LAYSVLLLLFPALMAYAAASDLLTMTISNKISLALAAGFFVFAAAAALPAAAIALHAAAGAVVLCVCFAMFAFGWIGGGDAKLAAATALWFGFDALPEYLILASLGGGALTVLVLTLRGTPLPQYVLGWEWLTRLHDRRAGVPYGIALAGAALLVYPETSLFKLLAP
jgi:prepilin peptidase CpaA